LPVVVPTAEANHADVQASISARNRGAGRDRVVDGCPADPPSVAKPLVTKAARQSPDDMIEMEVREVFPVPPHEGNGGGNMVVLSEKGTDTIVPIFVGDTEAIAIKLRLDRVAPPRPLTHDLLEKVIHTLGAKVTKIYIDDMRDSIYLGRIFLEYGDKSLELDARPSDSIALAVGSEAPIFAARKVVERAGFSRKDLEKGPTRTSEKATPAEPVRDDAL
jgi:bifunctional DNase/RNase